MIFKERFVNPTSGETLIHREREDGKRDLFIIPPDGNQNDHGHAVIYPDGHPAYIREFNGRVICDDKLP